MLIPIINRYNKCFVGKRFSCFKNKIETLVEITIEREAADKMHWLDWSGLVNTHLHCARSTLDLSSVDQFYQLIYISIYISLKTK